MIRELKEEVKDLKANRARDYSQSTTATHRSSPPNNILKFKYCWTHGCNRTHSSQHCRMPANNHKKDANIDNMMGGCQFNVGHFLQAKEKSSAWREQDAVSYLLNHSNNACSNLQYPFNANNAFLDSAAYNNYGNKQTQLNDKQ